jgi:hypothetical protein
VATPLGCCGTHRDGGLLVTIQPEKRTRIDDLRDL